jgi:hypothetical protein
MVFVLALSAFVPQTGAISAPRESTATMKLAVENVRARPSELSRMLRLTG